MARTSESARMANVEGPGQARGSFWRKLAKRKRALFALIPLVILMLPYFGDFSPLLYPHLAPKGWHNATPHGNLVLYSFAASTASPGLMVACGSAFSAIWTDPSTWNFGQLHFWRTRDGGARWDLLHPLFGDGQQCEVSVPDGEPHTIFVTVDSSSDPSSSDNVAVTWVSHDDASTWHRVTTSTAKSPAALDIYGFGDDYRNGLLYGYRAPDDSTNFTIASSADDGATWTAIPSTPSILQQQGWQDIGDLVPDYRADHWWYRALSATGQPPMLEHSTDDGRTWTQIAAIGDAPSANLVLATTPLLPDRLCAARYSGETDHMSIFASADQGKTWQTGTMPPSLAHTTGETQIGVDISSSGECYQGYVYHRASAPTDENDYAFARLAPNSVLLQVILLANEQNVADLLTTYVPAANGMPARLIVNSLLTTPGAAAAFSGLATETNAGQLLWAAVP